MSNKRGCERYKQLIMQEADGEITRAGKEAVKKHIRSCRDCAVYRKKTVKMMKKLSGVSFDAPYYLESKIMAAVREEAKPRVRFSLRQAFIYAASFGVVIVGSLLVINTGIDNGIYTPPDKAAYNIETGKNIKPGDKASNYAAAEPAEKEKKAVVSEAETNKAAEVKTAAPETAGESKTDIKTAGTALKRETGADKSAENKAIKISGSGFTAAKETPVPSPGDTLLDREKAIVGNNVINPARGGEAIIKVKVDDETARVKIKIYDKRVRVVKNILDEELGRGIYEARWGGDNYNNETVAEGIYFVYIRIGRMVIKKHIVVTR